jgi:peptidoglycan/xylan/chitin deacetylase (PgdA/CDA1 family)
VAPSRAQLRLNLHFHGVGEPRRSLDGDEERFWITADALDEILDAVVGRDDVWLSFDDSNESDTSLALPALAERGLGATFFVVAGRIGQPGFVDRAGLRRLAAAGMGIGCHGMRHRPWRGLDAAALREELVDARRLIEEASDQPVRAAACPFGSYDRRVLRALRLAGYERVYTSDDGLADPDEWLQPRAAIGRDHGAEVVELLARPAGTATELRRAVRAAIKRLR